MRAAFLAILLTFMPLQSLAAPIDLTVVAGIGKNVLGHQPFERYGALGVRWGNAWKVQANGGYWLALADGEKAAAFTSLQGGLEVVGQGGTFAQLMFGPGVISHIDSKLGGHFQFHLVGGVGMKDSGGHGLSFLWTHFSNAGVVMPNNGRDLLTIQLIAPLGAL